MAHHRVYFGQGAQVLRTVPHKNGPVVVSSATYAIYNPRYLSGDANHVLVAAGTAATMDTVSTTLSNVAGRIGADRKTITVTTTVGMAAGRQYLLRAPNGTEEVVKAHAILSGTQLVALSEIGGDFPTGSTIRGIEVSATFPADPANDDENLGDIPWLIVWVFNGIASPIQEPIYLERGEENQLASLDDLKELDPYVSTVGGNRISPERALARAHKDFRLDLMLAGANESEMVTADIGQNAVLYRAAELVFQHGDENDRYKSEIYGKRYTAIVTALQVGAKKPKILVLDKDQAATPINPAELFGFFGF